MRHHLYLATLLAASLALPAAPAFADLIITATQTGSDVVIQADGTLNTTGLTFIPGTFSGAALIKPIDPLLQVGSGSFDLYRESNGATAFVTFGTGGFTFADSSTGDVIAFSKNDDDFDLSVPTDYVSGDPLSGNATYASQTFATLGLTPGTYVYAYGSGPSADSITLSVVPEPSAFAFCSLAGLMLAKMWRRRS